MRWLAVVLLASCAGCSLVKMEDDRTQGPAIVETPKAETKSDVKSDTKTEELLKSNNVIQNQVTGLNLSLNQLATKMTGVEGDLLKIQNSLNVQTTASAELQTTIKSTITAVADVKNELTAHIKTTIELNSKIENNMQAQVKAVADLEATIKGLASAQVGFGNKLESRVEELSQKVSAGRDSVVSTVNFSQDVMKTIVYGNLFYMIVIVVIVLSIAAVMVVLINHSRGRAEKRYEDEKSERRMMMKNNVLNE